MLKTLRAFTKEIDEVDIAVSEILEQIDLDSLLKNSVGIISCFSEFTETEVLKAICDALPFPVVGCTTIASGGHDVSDMMALTMTVLTADDVTFTTLVTEAFTTDSAAIPTAYTQIVETMTQKPELIFALFPMLNDVGAEAMLDSLISASGNIPIIGTVCVDHTPDFHTSKTIYNGNKYDKSAVMVLISGNIHPTFITSGIPEQKLQKQSAVVTDSDGCVIRGINGKDPLQYMREIGLWKGDGLEAMYTIPFILDFNNETQPLPRALYISVENGILCGGKAPIGSTLSIASIDENIVLEGAAQVATQINQMADAKMVFLFPCLSRLAVMGTKPLAELDQLVKEIRKDILIHICYSGGEYCPLPQDNNINRLHNFSLVACVL